ncbi:MAG: transglycosylase SLT domain-containing protein [Actinomycetota bacterium]
MTDRIDTGAETGATRLDALADAGGRPGRGDGAIPGSGDAATFEALVRQASGGRVGQLVDRLPDGAAAQAWARWQPSGAALGARSAVTAGTASLSGRVGSGSPGGMTLPGTVIGTGRPSAGATGTVFPVAQNVGEAVVNAAADHLGVPYLWGGTDAEHGFDCSGLIQDAYRRVGVEMPKWSRHQATMGVEVPSIDEAMPGDVLTFGEPVNHVALYVGDGQMLHAPRTGEVVKIETIDRPINEIRRIVTPGGVTPGGATPGVWPSAGRAGSVPSASTTFGPDTPYAELFESAGRRHDVDPALLAAVARAESAFDPTAVSPVGAQGLMQFMPATAEEMGVDPWDPASAIDGAARYLRTSLDRFGSVDLAVASYNAGPGAVARYGGIPPYPETQNYVRTVLDTWRSRS